MKTLDYIFYRFYRFQLTVGNDTTTVGSTIIGLAGSLTFNMAAMFNILNYFINLGQYYPNYFAYFTYFIPIFLVSIFFVLLFIVLSNKKRFKEILKKYNKETKKEIIRGNLYILAYLILTVVILVLSFFLIIPDGRAATIDGFNP